MDVVLKEIILVCVCDITTIHGLVLYTPAYTVIVCEEGVLL